MTSNKYGWTVAQITWRVIKLVGCWNKKRDEQQNWFDCGTSNVMSNKLQYLCLSRTNFIASHAGRSVWRVSGGATLRVRFLTRCYTNPNSLLAPVSLFLQSAFSWEASFQLFGKPTEFTLQTKKRSRLTIGLPVKMLKQSSKMLLKNFSCKYSE